MTDSTKAAVTAILRADPTVSKDQLSGAVRLLEGKGKCGKSSAEVLRDRSLTRKQVAEILGVKPNTVTVIASRGLIGKILTGKDQKRAIGYSERDVMALIRNSELANCS